MTPEALSATTTVQASADAIFAVLADPASHAAIDGTGWVCEPLNSQRLTSLGQVFRMVMYHPRHPDGRYRTANQVQELHPPYVIAWATGTEELTAASASAAGSGATTSRRNQSAALGCG